MPRTTSALVQEVLQAGKDYDTINNPSLTPYIAAASMVVDQVKDLAPGRGYSYSDSQLELIERWLAAHFYQQSDQGYQSKSTAGASASFQGQRGKGFESTNYGLTALRMDVSGVLDVIDKRRFAYSFWLGKNPNSQIPYSQRR